MLDLQNTHKFTIFRYNFRLVNVVVVEEQMPVKDLLYMKDDKLKLPLWLAKQLYKDNFLIIEEFENMDNTINKIYATQKLNKNNLVPLDPDFYLLVNDYFNFYMKYKLKYLDLNDQLTENQKIKTEMEIKDLLNTKKNQIQSLVDMRKKILILSAYYGYNENITKNMSFEEVLIYKNVTDSLGCFDNFFSYTNKDNI